MTDNELYHFGVKGMKWGVRRKAAANKLNRKANRTNKYQRIADEWNMAANAAEKQAIKAGPVAYGRQYNSIKKMRTNSKQFQKYADFSRKRTSAYMNKLSNNYTVVYDVSSGTYSLRDKNEN